MEKTNQPLNKVGLGYARAVQHLTIPEMSATSRYKVLQQRAEWHGVNEHVKTFAKRFVKQAAQRGIPLYVHSAMRSEIEQTRAYVTGRSKVKYPDSPHNVGLAVDIVHAEYHWQLTRDEWVILSEIGFQIAKTLPLEVTWGGHWKFYDPAHWQFLPKA